MKNLKIGQSIIIADTSWMDKIVLNPKTGNKVKIRSLPKDLRDKYKPKTTPRDKSSSFNEERHHHEFKNDDGEPIKITKHSTVYPSGLYGPMSGTSETYKIHVGDKKLSLPMIDTIMNQSLKDPEKHEEKLKEMYKIAKQDPDKFHENYEKHKNKKALTDEVKDLEVKLKHHEEKLKESILKKRAASTIKMHKDGIKDFKKRIKELQEQLKT